MVPFRGHRASPREAGGSCTKRWTQAAGAILRGSNSTTRRPRGRIVPGPRGPGTARPHHHLDRGAMTNKPTHYSTSLTPAPDKSCPTGVQASPQALPRIPRRSTSPTVSINAAPAVRLAAFMAPALGALASLSHVVGSDSVRVICIRPETRQVRTTPVRPQLRRAGAVDATEAGPPARVVGTSGSHAFRGKGRQGWGAR